MVTQAHFFKKGDQIQYIAEAYVQISSACSEFYPPFTVTEIKKRSGGESDLITYRDSNGKENSASAAWLKPYIRKTQLNECYIDDEWIEFSFQSRADLETVKKEHPSLYYLGSGIKKRYNGYDPDEKYVYHYFSHKEHKKKTMERYRLIKVHPGRSPHIGEGRIVKRNCDWGQFNRDGFVMSEHEVCNWPEYWQKLDDKDIGAEVGDYIRDKSGNIRKLDGIKIVKDKIYFTVDGDPSLFCTTDSEMIISILPKLKFSFGGYNLKIEIPTKDDNCSNWNEPYCWQDHISVTCKDEVGTLRYIKNLIDIYEAKFGKVQLKSALEIGCVKNGTIEELKVMYNTVEELMKPVIGSTKKKNFKLTIE